MTDDPTLLVPDVVPPRHFGDLRDALAADGRVPADALARAKTPEETDAMLPDADAVCTFRTPDLDRAESLRWVQALSAGVDSYDREALREHDVVLTNVSGVHAEPIAEQTFAYMLAFERDLLTGIEQKRENLWMRYHGGELKGKTLGIIGLGAIGSRVAELGQAFGMTVVGTKRDPSNAPDAADEVLPADEHLAVCERADYLVLACPLTDATSELIGAPELRLLGDEGVLVNVARGEVVETDTLVGYLRGDRIRGAALDAFETEPLPEESPLWDLPNVVVTPHQAGTTPAWPRRCAEIIGANYEALCGRGEWVNQR